MSVATDLAFPWMEAASQSHNARLRISFAGSPMREHANGKGAEYGCK
jgi:hypothetical protein